MKQNQSLFNTQMKTTLACKLFWFCFCTELNKKEIDVIIVPKGDYCVVSNWAGGDNYLGKCQLYIVKLFLI